MKRVTSKSAIAIEFVFMSKFMLGGRLCPDPLRELKHSLDFILCHKCTN